MKLPQLFLITLLKLSLTPSVVSGLIGRRLVLLAVMAVALSSGQSVAWAASTTTTLTSTPSPSYVGQSVSLRGTVSPSAATGTVTFRDGTTVLGTATLSSGVATLSVSFSATGSRSLRATYNGATGYTTSTSATRTHTVNARVASSTALTSTVNPSYVGQSTTLRATVTGSSPSGSVTFRDGSTTLGSATLASGVASFTTSFATAGSRSLTAVYAGDVANNPSTSAVRTQTVNARASSTTVLSSSINPSQVGQSTTLRAVLTPSSATGTVTFRDGSTSLGTVTVASGAASLAVAFNTAGTRSLTAEYSGNTSTNSSTSTAVSQTVNTALTTTTTTISSNANPAVLGQSVVLTSTVVPSSATGTITFRDGSATLGTANISSGTATLTTSFSATGSHSLTATYSGSASHATSVSSALSQTVNKLGTVSTLTSSVNPSSIGQATTLTATVNPAAATGSVTFRSGSTSLGSANLSGGIATLNTNFGAAGTFGLTAVYAGDSTYANSTSSAVSQVVSSRPATTTSLAITPSPSFINQLVVLRATVNPAPADGTVMVDFRDGSGSIGTGYVYGGVASLSHSFGVAGSRTLSAVFAGNSQYSGSTSPTVAHVVSERRATSVAIAADANPVYRWDSVLLTATITPSTATGTVTFAEPSGSIGGTVQVVGGVAALRVTPSNPGVYNITATYAGDTENASGASSPLAFNVRGPEPTSTTLTSSVNPSVSGQNTVLVATVTPSSATGEIRFYDGSTMLATIKAVGGVARMNTSFGAAGTRSLRAVYGESRTHAESSSPTIAQTVTAAATTPSSTSVSVNPNPINLGQPVTLTAVVWPSAATGTVTFYDGGTSLGSGTVRSGGIATLTTQFQVSGTRYFTAVYSGDSTYSASTSRVAAAASNSRTVLATSGNPTVVGQSVSLTATIFPPSATGNVTFFEGSTTLGSSPVNFGVATLPAAFASAGLHSLTAAYSGDDNNQSSFSEALNQIVNPTNPPPVGAPTSLTLSSSATSVQSGGTVALSASLAGSAPTGSVVFKDGATTIATVALSGGMATTNAVLTGAGLHVLSATYAGDANNQSTDSNAVGVQVSAGAGAPPGAMTWLYGYDPQGNRWIDIDPRGLETSRNFDGLGRATDEVRPPGLGASSPTVVRTAYDGQGNTKSVTDPRGLVTSYSVDGLGQAGSTVSPDTGTSNATFDAAGNVLTRTDSRGKVTTYTYDALNRLIRIAYASGTPTVFEYDGGAAPGPNTAGRLTRITDESGSTAYQYDARGRVLSKTQVIGSRTLQTSYAWGSTGSATGALTSVTYPSGARVNYDYDAAGRVSGMRLNPPNPNGVGTNLSQSIVLLSGVQYNADNAISSWLWSDGTVASRGFDSFGRLSSYPLGKPDGTGSAAGLLRTLVYDDAGRIVGYTHTRSGVAQSQFDQSFVYDDLNQVVGNTHAATSYGYSYDATGNRTMRVVAGSSYPQAIASTSNRLMQAQSASGTRTFTYDNAGNVLSDSTVTYVYGDRGRMSTATLGANTVSYTYNGLDQRVRKTGPVALVASGGAYYAYDEAGRSIGEYDFNLVPIYETVYLGSMPVAVLKQTGVAANSTISMSPYNLWADHIDTPRVITRANDQAIVWRWDTAEAFGATVPDQNPSGFGAFGFNQRFPGQISDIETGNFYNYFRDYDATTGRYIQSDPIGLQGGVNTYTYVGSSPAEDIDPTGLVVWNGSITFTGASGRVRPIKKLPGLKVTAWDVELTLESECVNGKRIKKTLKNSGPVYQSGMSVPALAYDSSVKNYDDGLPTPEVDSLTGLTRFDISGFLGVGGNGRILHHSGATGRIPIFGGGGVIMGSHKLTAELVVTNHRVYDDCTCPPAK